MVSKIVTVVLALVMSLSAKAVQADALGNMDAVTGALNGYLKGLTEQAIQKERTDQISNLANQFRDELIRDQNTFFEALKDQSDQSARYFKGQLALITSESTACQTSKVTAQESGSSTSVDEMMRRLSDLQQLVEGEKAEIGRRAEDSLHTADRICASTNMSDFSEWYNCAVAKSKSQNIATLELNTELLRGQVDILYVSPLREMSKCFASKGSIYSDRIDYWTRDIYATQVGVGKVLDGYSQASIELLP